MSLTRADTRLDVGAAVEDLRQRGVRWATCAWVDVSGRPKGKVIALDRIPDAVRGGDLYTPRGLAGVGRSSPAEPEGHTVPDLAAAVQLPTDPTLAWIPSDIHLGESPFAHCSRSVLKREVARAAALGYRVNVGMECEVHLLRRGVDGSLQPLAGSSDFQPTPLYDIRAVLETDTVIRPMAMAMEELGWSLEAYDQECGRGQVEFDFGYTDAVGMADRLVLFRFLLAEYARRAGAIASFMPKPFADGWGSGAHINMSFADFESGENLFTDPGEMVANGSARSAQVRGYSALAHHAAAGMLRHAGAVTALSAPGVNSYKRLVPQGALPDITWAPTVVAYGSNNRSCMLRLPGSRRCIEDRIADISCNPHLAIAIHVAAALEGIEQALDPGPPCHDDTFQLDMAEMRRRGYRRIPRTLLEAAEALETDPLAQSVLGPELHRDYVEAKRREWDEYHTQVTAWEVDRYLEAL